MKYTKAWIKSSLDLSKAPISVSKAIYIVTITTKSLSTNEWTDGVLSAVMRKTCSEDTPDEKWILFDGPVDTLWIESMNSVMDDNKVLTLINGERISMPQQVGLKGCICKAHIDLKNRFLR